MSYLSEDRFLADLYSKDQIQAAFAQKIIDAINNIARAVGVSPAGDLTPPPPVNAITVKTSGEMVHATLSHSAQVTRAINYFIEADTNPSFTQPHVMDLGVSRSHVFHLPAFNDSGVPQKWYLRAYGQYPGSSASRPTVLGGLTGPTALTLQGTTRMTLLPSTGSGTASQTGQQGGQGRGKQRESTPKVIRLGKSQASSTPVVPPVSSAALHFLATVASAAANTGLTQNGTSTTINIAAGTFYLGDLVIIANAGSVNPGSYGTWYIYHDDPLLQGGNVNYQFTSDITVIGRGFARFYSGSCTTAAGGGGSGGGSSGGGGRGQLR